MPKDDLHGKTLDHVNLDGCDLSDSDLSNTSLRYSHLRGAKLRGVSLLGSDLHGAQLDRADIAGADLGHADLTEAHLRGVDLSTAASSVGIRLEGAEGLTDEVMEGDRRSKVDEDTVLNVRPVREPAPADRTASTEAQQEQDRQLVTGEENPT